MELIEAKTRTYHRNKKQYICPIESLPLDNCSMNEGPVFPLCFWQRTFMFHFIDTRHEMAYAPEKLFYTYMLPTDIEDFSFCPWWKQGILIFDDVETFPGKISHFEKVIRKNPKYLKKSLIHEFRYLNLVYLSVLKDVNVGQKSRFKNTN